MIETIDGQVLTIESVAADEVANLLGKLDGELRVTVINIGSEGIKGDIRGLARAIKQAAIPVILVCGGDVDSGVFEIIEAAHICYADDNSNFEIQSGAATLSHDEAVCAGLINDRKGLTPIEAARKTSRKIADLAPRAIRSCIAAVESESYEREVELFAELFDSKDIKRGTKAFFEKKKPVFRGD